MIQQRKNFFATRAPRLALGVLLAGGVCAAVAAPMGFSRDVSPAAPAAKVAFQALGEGPAVSVKRSFGRHDEDCITVTQIKGADGRIYPTRGMVCSQ